MDKIIIIPNMNNINPTPIKRPKVLFKDHGWKGKSEFSCKLCSFYTSACKTEENGYKEAYPMITHHLILEHPEYCYGCKLCDKLFHTIKDFTSHYKDEHNKKKP